MVVTTTIGVNKETVERLDFLKSAIVVSRAGHPEEIMALNMTRDEMINLALNALEMIYENQGVLMKLMKPEDRELLKGSIFYYRKE